MDQSSGANSFPCIAGTELTNVWGCLRDYEGYLNVGVPIDLIIEELDIG